MNPTKTPATTVSSSSEPQLGLIRRFLQWLLALFSPARPTQPDGFVEGLLADVARQLAPKLGITGTELAAMLTRMRQGQAEGKPSTVTRVDCTLTKETASRVKLSVQVLHQDNGKPLITSLEKTVSWDDLPPDVRSQFIHIGGRELHHVLCESQQPEPKINPQTD